MQRWGQAPGQDPPRVLTPLVPSPRSPSRHRPPRDVGHVDVDDAVERGLPLRDADGPDGRALRGPAPTSAGAALGGAAWGSVVERVRASVVARIALRIVTSSMAVRRSSAASPRTLAERRGPRPRSSACPVTVGIRRASDGTRPSVRDRRRCPMETGRGQPTSRAGRRCPRRSSSRIPPSLHRGGQARSDSPDSRRRTPAEDRTRWPSAAPD